MKNLKFLLVIVPLLVMFGCRKEEVPTTTIIEGRVLEGGTDRPLENAEVWVVRPGDCSFTTGGCSYIEVEGTRVKTDANGRYRIEFPHRDRATLYEIRANYESGFRLFTPDGIQVAQTNQINLFLVAPARLILNIKNVNPYGVRDSIFFSDGFGGLYGLRIAIMDEVVTMEKSANLTFALRYRLKVDGLFRPWVTDSIKLNTKETRTYNVHY